jgi:hypothetical protein
MDPAAECNAFLDVLPAPAADAEEMAEDLEFHDNRYSWMGDGLRRTAVRFGWSAVSFAEIRDLNRHRTGSKYCPLVPRGFYSAQDALPSQYRQAGESQTLSKLSAMGRAITADAAVLMRAGRPDYIYGTLLGAQYLFEHTTTADKFLYEAELRTGVGAHFRYAQHLHDALALWYERFPETKSRVLEGSAEPE